MRIKRSNKASNGASSNGSSPRKNRGDDDEEKVSLVAGAGQEEGGGGETTHSSNISSGIKLLLGIIVAGCFAFFLWDNLECDKDPSDILMKSGSTRKSGNSKVVVRRSSKPKLTNSKVMLERLLAVRQNWIETKLWKEYGQDNYRNIFEPTMEDDNPETRVNIGKQRFFVDPNQMPRRNKNYEEFKNKAIGPAWSRMVRKWTIKLLQIQLAMLEEPEQQQQDKHNGDAPNVVADDNQESPTTTYAKFVWANGGHSASAGHGNFYKTSYTAVLGQDLQPTLQEIGLDFQVRNYAMGGTSSGEEVALCFNSIFGRDIDSITWDYGMTDGWDYHNLLLYTYNAAKVSLLEDSVSQPGNIAHRPSLWLIHNEDSMRTEILQSLQNLGMSILVMDDRFKKDKIYPGYPDMFGKTDAEIAATPPYVQYFKCNDAVETGDPGCADKKFNLTICPERSGRNTWHPGWRYHAMIGHSLAMTIFELITEGLNNLIQQEPANVHEESPQERHNRLSLQLQELDEQERSAYHHMVKNPIPIDLRLLFEENLWKGDNKDANKEAMKDLGLIETFVSDFPMCHTAILPADIRYNGILTENFNETGTVMDQNFEHGILLSKLKEADNPSAEGDGNVVSPNFLNAHPDRDPQMVIGTNDDEYEECPELTQQDHMDFFFVSSREGWRTMSFPNDAEQHHFTEFDARNSNGWVFACMMNCPWGDCPEGDIRKNFIDGAFDAGESGKIEMQVNAINVVDVKCFNKCCALLHDSDNPNGRFVWSPNEEGKYEFQVRITGGSKYSYLRFSSFITI